MYDQLPRDIKMEQISLYKEMHVLIEDIRIIFEDDISVQRMMSDKYENLIWSKLKLIPISNIPEIMKYCDMAREFIECINMDRLLSFINAYQLCKNVNSKEIIEKFISSTELISPKVAGLVLNLMDTFQIVFQCIDKIIEDPNRYLSKLVKNNIEDLLE